MRQIEGAMKLYIFFLLICNALLFSQPAEDPCSSSEADQFDFWLGEWDLEWTDKDGNVQTASNKVEKILGSCVVKENFDASQSIGFIGKSYSVYVPWEKIWKQTWVDNSGGYLDFTGGFENDQMILSRTAKVGDKVFMQRMIFYDITSDSFMWNWEGSKDEGETWQLQWQLHYKRKS
jgi:hypothetical protein